MVVRNLDAPRFDHEALTARALLPPIHLPWPPSINHRRQGGLAYGRKTPAAARFSASAAWHVVQARMAAKIHRPITGPVVVGAWYHPLPSAGAWDLDNVAKALWDDALVAGGLIRDDSLIQASIAVKATKADPPYVEVVLWDPSELAWLWYLAG